MLCCAWADAESGCFESSLTPLDLSSSPRSGIQLTQVTLINVSVKVPQGCFGEVGLEYCTVHQPPPNLPALFLQGERDSHTWPPKLVGSSIYLPLCNGQRASCLLLT